MRIPQLFDSSPKSLFEWATAISAILENQLYVPDQTPRFGRTIIDFGGGNAQASVTVYGQTDLEPNDAIFAVVDLRATVNHTVAAHKTVQMDLRTEIIQPRSHFTIHGAARSGVLTTKWSVLWMRARR